MKTKILALAVVLSAFSMNAKAQKVRSLTIGVAPVGYTQAKISYSNSKREEKYKYDYKSYFNFNVGYERQFKGVTALTEFTYAKAKFDKYDLEGQSEKFNPMQSEDISSASLIFYMGKTLNPGKRIQFPLYIGIGGEYLSGGPFHNLAFDVAVKARVKYYITDNVGVFAGASARYGFGALGFSRGEKEVATSDRWAYALSNTMCYIDAGITIGL